MDVKSIRSNFKVLSQKLNGKQIIYFDNACQTLRPRQVIEAVDQYYLEYPACAGRSSHKLGVKVTDKVHEARQKIAKFIGAKRPEEVVFTRNTTEGMNLVVHALDWQEGDEVIITDKEHNSNLIPWQILAKEKGVRFRISPSKKDNSFDVEAFKALLNEKTKLVSMVVTSNLDGVTNPIKEIIKLAHENKSLVLLDGAQAVPHMRVDVGDLDVDFLAFSGHKMLGPSGTGVLYGKYKLLERIKPFMVGGDTVERSSYEDFVLLPPPEKFEAGLQDYAGIIGLGAAVDYLNQIGFDDIKKQELKLNQMVSDELLRMERVHVIGPTEAEKRGGIFSFYVDGVDVHQLALMLDETENIMIRSGQHCVHSWFKAHNLDGSARLSFYFYNTQDEAAVFIDVFKKLIKVL
ncbi:MAG: cysteine desulfurase [bacterium]|nr:cysteine desulfurase [bacterium]